MNKKSGVFPDTEAEPSAAVDGAATVRVLARGLALLLAFCPRNKPQTNSALATATGLPKPTVSRLTATMTRLGYLDYLAEQASYRLGHGALALGYGALSTLDIRVRARAHMQRFADQHDLLVVLAVREGMAMVCQEVCRGGGALTIRVGVGSRLVLPHSAMGRAWIASLAPAPHAALMTELRQNFPENALHPALQEAAEQAAARGFCVTVSSLEPDVNSVATMVEFPQTPGQYVLGCSVPAFRYPPERCTAEIGPALLALRRQIENDLLPPANQEPR